MKHIRKKIIKGKEYYYFEFSIKDMPKDKKTFTRYIGKQLPEQKELKLLINNYFDEISKIIIENIDKKTTDYFPPNGVNRIESARALFRCLNHELYETDLKLFKDLFTVLFVLNSNRAEGSKVTREQIEQIVNRKTKARTKIDTEIINSLNAINFAFSKKMKWNVASIKKIHRLLFEGIDGEIAGRFKKQDNVVGAGGPASVTSPKERVKSDMNQMVKWLKEGRGNIYPPIIALKLHWRFEQIHPFLDGNGRVGRILLNSLLAEAGFMPVIFFSENHKAYSSAIAKAIEGREGKISKYFIEQLKKIGKRIEEYKKEGKIKGGSSSIGKWEIQHDKIRIY